MTSDLPVCPPFADFYRAVHGRDPFPWQDRLARLVADTGRWPREIGVPTGLGKTSCLDIAVWWLAAQADLSPGERTAPTRIWWLVNRRLLVDSTADHATRLAELLAGADGGPEGPGVLGAVALRLASLSAAPDGRPLEVTRLRGGVAAGRPTDPSQPAVILSTLPMYGSRLLFRGYGVSRSMRPIEAALAGTDALVLVDEAHLARHLMNLFPALRDCTPAARSPVPEGRDRPVVVSLTATGDAGDDRFDLDESDEAHPVVARRLDAAKPVELWVVDKERKGDPARSVAEATVQALEAQPEPVAALVFVNTPAVAREVAARLEKDLASEAEIVVSTGRAREHDSARVRERILDPVAGMPADRPVRPRPHHLVVVATQTLEVGADIDAELLVTEACGVRALTQRLGRLNRLGRHPAARAVYVHVEPKRKDKQGNPIWPVYGAEPAEVLRQLQAAAGEGGVVDLSPRRVSVVLGDPGDDPGRAPEILPGLLWEWVKTTTPPDGEAPVEPYFSGIRRPDRSVSLVWRAHVPASGDRIWPRVREREVVDVPIGELREVLDEESEATRLGVDGVTVEICPVGRLRPGDVVVLPSDAGLLDEYGWAPEAKAPVLDVSLLDAGLPLDAGALRRLCGVAVAELVTRALGGSPGEELDPDEQVAAVEELLEVLRDAPPPMLEAEQWSAFLSGLDREAVVVPSEVPRLRWSGDEAEVLVDELDELSLTATAVELERHGAGVGARARAVAESVGLDPGLVSVVELAGRFHDLGKADPRFQRWLDPTGEAGTLLAKSTTPRHRWARSRLAAGWPDGGRHEDLSARLVRAWLRDGAAGLDDHEVDLLVHLVISHHGRGRPLVPPADDTTGGRVRVEVEGRHVEADADLSVIDWEQPARFRRLNDVYGPWGLALLEAVVRRADHAVSAGGWAGAEVQ